MTFHEFRTLRLIVRPAMLFLALVGAFAFFYPGTTLENRESILWTAVVLGAAWITYEVALLMVAAEVKRTQIVAQQVDMPRMYEGEPRP